MYQSGYEDPGVYNPRYCRPAGDSETSSEDSFVISGFDKKRQDRSKLANDGNTDFKASRSIVDREEEAMTTALKLKTSEAIRTACIRGSLDVIKTQLQLVPNLDINKLYETPAEIPLNTACLFGHLPIVRYLLEELKINHTLGTETCPPLIAVASSAADDQVLVQIAELLIAAGFDVNVMDNRGQTALQVAVHHDKLTLAEILLNHGANPNLPDFDHQTALFIAASEGNQRMANLLIRFNANLELVDKNGWTVVDLAEYSNHCQLATHLQACLERKTAGLPILTAESPISSLVESSVEPVQEPSDDENLLKTLLDSCKCSKYLNKFKSQGISYEKVLTLSDAELAELGVAEIGIREKLLSTIKAVHNTPWASTSIRTFQGNLNLNAADVTSSVANCETHLKHILTSLEYTTGRTRDNPSLLEQISEQGRLLETHNLCKQIHQSCGMIKTKLEGLRKTLTGHENCSELQIVGRLGSKGEDQPCHFSFGLPAGATLRLILAAGIILFVRRFRYNL